MNYIDFPKEEYDTYLKGLFENKVIYTTRVSNEVGKYIINNIYLSPFGKLKVIELKHFSLLNAHPFINELTKSKKMLLKSILLTLDMI